MLVNREPDLVIPDLPHTKLKSKDELKMFLPLFQTDRLRCLIVGATGSGKTHLLMTLLQKFIHYTRLIICAPEPSLKQGFYWEFKKESNITDKKLRKKELLGDDEETVQLRELDDVPSVEELWVDPEPDSDDDDDEDSDCEDEEEEERELSPSYVVIIDDFAGMSKQAIANLEDLLKRGSRLKLHLILLGQSLIQKSLPRPLRNNCNSFIMMKNNSPEDFLRVFGYFPHITKLDGQTLVALLQRDQHGFIICNKDAPTDAKKILFGGGQYFVPNQRANAIIQENPRNDEPGRLPEDDTDKAPGTRTTRK